MRAEVEGWDLDLETEDDEVGRPLSSGLLLSTQLCSSTPT